MFQRGHFLNSCAYVGKLKCKFSRDSFEIHNSWWHLKNLYFASGLWTSNSVTVETIIHVQIQVSLL